MEHVLEAVEGKTTDDRINVKPTSPKGSGLKRHFVPVLGGAEEMFDWGEFDVQIDSADGKIIFEQRGIKAPAQWSNQAIKITANKYFRNIKGKREDNVEHMVNRIVRTIAGWGREDGYFADNEEIEAFKDELAFLFYDQRACFNSPVLFNVGIYDQPQCSACFILKIEDDMESILRWYRNEGVIFKYGSGSGINLSPLRSSKETCSDGAGKASGPLSFMKPADANAGVIRSGGKCLAFEQPVFTAAGPRTAIELTRSNRLFTVLSFSKRLGRVAAKRARAWLSGEKEMVRVFTDKGEFVVSKDHPFMLKTGELLEAGKLKTGQRSTSGENRCKRLCACRTARR